MIGGPSLRVKNWREFQHYTDRRPPWIKLHVGLLENYEFQCLPLASRALAPMLWLLASESDEGLIDGDPVRLAFRLRWSEKELKAGLKPLIDKGFIEDASSALADCKQVATSETEAEREREAEAEREGAARARPTKRCPPDFVVTPDMRAWAEAERPNVNIDSATAAFRDHTFATARSDWPATWRNWIRREKPNHASVASLTRYERNMQRLRAPEVAPAVENFLLTGTTI